MDEQGEKKTTITINGKEYEKVDLPTELTFVLRKPLEIANQSIATIELQEPTAGDYEQFSKAAAAGNSASAMIKLVSLVANKSNSLISEPIIRRIGMKDMMEMSSYMLVFITPGQ